jgi:hypothetical protein
MAILRITGRGASCAWTSLTERTLKPTNMYQVEVASIANV